MGDIVEFPNNYNRLIEKAVSYHKKNQLDIAIDYYQQAYMFKKSFQLNQILVSIYLENSEPLEALGIAEEYENEYKSKSKVKLFFVSLLIESKEFDRAEILIKEELEKDLNENHSEKWTSAENQLRNKEQDEREQIEEFNAEIREKLYSLNSYSTEEQLQIVKDASHLDLEIIKQASGLIFPNPYIHHFSKIGILEYLIIEKDDTTYDFEWHGYNKKIKPSNLSLFENNRTVMEINDILQNSLEKNPSLFEMIYPTAQLHLMELFPFIEEVVTNCNKWVDIYLIEFGDHPNINHEDKEREKMKKWFDSLNN